MSIKTLLGAKGRQALKAYNLTAICGSITYKMCEPKCITILWASTACYGDSFTILYVVDVRTSQQTHASTVSYGDNFTFLYVDDVRTPQETHVSRFTFLCR
jgi:hypothetical protein